MAFFFAIFPVLSACGDGQPELSSRNRSGTDEGFSTNRNESEIKTTTDFIPFASDFLRYSDGNSASPDGNRALSEFNFSSSLGNFPEIAGELSENLGLVADNEENSYRTLFGRLPAGLAWSSVGKAKPLSLDASQSELLHEVQLSFEDIPIHGARIKSIHDHSSNTTTFMSGSVPGWMMKSAGESLRVIPFSLSPHQARMKASQALGFVDWRFHSPTKVYLAQSRDSLLPVYLFTVSAESPEQGRGPRLPIEAAVNADTGDIIWQRPLAMHAVDGQALLYVENKRAAGGDSAIRSGVTLPGLVGDGSKLSHPLFDVLNCHQVARMNSDCELKSHAVTQGNFSSVGYDNETYDELISYAAITKAMDWFKAIDTNSLRTSWDDTKWPGTRANFGLQPSGSNGGGEKRLNIFVRTRTQTATTNPTTGEDTTADNAQYLWSGYTGGGGPEILIGYGSYDPNCRSNCSGLRDLGKDMDVIMHEFGHHIVFRGLSNAKSQSVAMHEGLADYFTYAISGNNRLAEYSRPGYLALRQANITDGTTFKNFKPKTGGGYYSVMDYLPTPHIVGEFWSGILWTIRTQMGMNASNTTNKFDKIVWDSIDLLKSDAGLYEGIVSLLESAKRYARSNGDDETALQKVIQDAFVKYGFAQYDAAGQFSAVAELMSGVVVSSEAPVTKVNKTKRWGCGDVALSASVRHDTSSFMGPALLAGLLLLPAFLVRSAESLRSARRRVVVRIRKDKPRI